MDYNIRKVNNNDGQQIIDIFNYYIENSFAAFLDHKLEYDAFQPLLTMINGYPFYAVEEETAIIGFGFIGKYHPSAAFNKVAELTYFILPPYTHRGLGTRLFNILSAEAKKLGIETLLANITSLNHTSINFHLALGFTECGRFARIGRKNNVEFDVVWMQKFI